MARIDKLRVQGLRSFGPEDQHCQTLTFTSPITCIVGQNGCGKTTIIESLRYATTGNCPPGTSAGKSYVYDPKLTMSGEVKGQVKLQFINVKGQVMMVTRTLQVSQKLETLVSKSIEPTLQLMQENGEVQTLSGRCQDLNELMINNLGISQAILDNVIFCHQDDSFWPLDEPKKLKEKFDDIFDAAKYNKCSDSVAKIRKVKMAALKSVREAMVFLKQRVDEVREKTKELDGIRRKVAEGEAMSQKLRERNKPLEEELKLTHNREKRFLDLQTNISSLETQKSSLESQQRELEDKIPTLHQGSKQELQAFIRNFHSQLESKKNEISQQESEVARLVQQEKDSLKRINSEQLKLGSLQQEQDTNKETARQRLQALLAVAKDLNVPGVPCEGPGTTAEVEVSLKQVEVKMKDREQQLLELKKAHKKQEDNLQKDIDKKRELRVEADQGVKSLEQQVNTISEQLTQTRDEIKQVDTSVAKLTSLQTQLDRADREFEEAEQEMDSEASQRTIEGTQRERNRVDAEASALDAEVELLQKASSLQAEADVHRASLTKQQLEIRQLKEKHKDSLKELFRKVPEHSFLTELDALIKQREIEIKELRGKLESGQTQQTKMGVEHQHQKQKLKEMEKLLATSNASIAKVCGDKDFDVVLSEVEEAMHIAQDKKGMLDASRVLNRTYLSKLQKAKPCCPLCHRDFKVKAELDSLVSELEESVQQLPSQTTEVTGRLEELQVRHSLLLQLKPAHERVAQLKASEIPDIKEALEETEMLLATARMEGEDLVARLKDPERHLSLALGLRPVAALLEQHETESKRLTRELQRIERGLPNVGSGRTLAEAQNEQRTLRAEVQRLQRETEAKQRALAAHNKRVAELREHRNALKEQLLKIQAGAQRRSQLLERVKELGEQLATLSEALENAREAVTPARLELEEAERAKKRAVEENNTQLDAKRKELGSLQTKVEQVKRLNANVKVFEDRGVARTLEALQRSVETLQRQREELMMRRQEVSGRIEELNTELSSQQVRERELDDNLKLLEKREQVATIEEKLEKLCSELGSLNYVELMERKQKLCREITQINAELSKLEGTQEGFSSQADAIAKELEKDYYKNAEKNYRENMVKNKVLQHCIVDLQLYFTALNNSMIHFHQERMQTVNRIIRELWTSIYKGSDIDYIEIKTEADSNLGSASSTTSRRTYNYRVVMVKSNTELDMRGRCSAGQKMLASLVIRIALAETFSANCGILALDEPTTNLDHSNIDSLSASLIDLAQNHRFQSNFQMIIITHDEDFIEHLTKAGLISYFYRISRSDEGHSLIKKFRVGE